MAPRPFPLQSILRLLASLFLLLAVGCRKEPSSANDDAAPTAQIVPETNAPPWFEDVTNKSRLNFIHDAGSVGSYFMPEMVGSGAALFDYDGDGRLDIYLVQNGGSESQSKNGLFHQEADGTFIDVSAGSGLDVAGRGMGVAIGDVNNDGRPDVVVCEYGAVRLFLNDGGGKFHEVTIASGLSDPHWACAASFIDYDRDGWLDLVVVNYVDYIETKHCSGPGGKPDYCGPTSFQGMPARLYHNLGKAATGGVRFEDVTSKAGLEKLPEAGLGVVCADFDGDGWPDIFITNDAQPNALWINQHDGTFKEEGVLRGIAYNALGRPQANMGIAFGDPEGSGLPDVYVTHLTEESNILWSQKPAGSFQDRTAAAGLANPRWHATGFGAVFADFDQDGWPDLAVVNGRVRKDTRAGAASQLVPELGPYWSEYAERNQIFSNAAGKFHDISLSNAAFCGNPRVGRGLAYADIDGDGAIDLLVTNVAGPARIYRNVVSNRGHWLIVRATEPALGGRDAYGATVSIQGGDRTQTGWVIPGNSYQCSSDPRVHFGLGKSDRFEAIHVIWPDGSGEYFPGGPANRVWVLHHGEGTPTPAGKQQ